MNAPFRKLTARDLEFKRDAAAPKVNIKKQDPKKPASAKPKEEKN